MMFLSKMMFTVFDFHRRQILPSKADPSTVCLYSFYIDKLLLNASKCLKIYEIYSGNMSQVSLLMNCLWL